MSTGSGTPPERTYDGSRAVLAITLPEVRKTAGEAAIRGVLSQDLVNEILEVAWNHRLDRHPETRQREVGELVSEAVEEQILRDGTAS